MVDPVIRLDVFSDVACPWCYIGKRRLAAALRLPEVPEVRVRWRAFQLQPDLPCEGVEAAPFFERKFGGKRAAASAFARVQAIGAEEGLTFHFDRIRRVPNTLLAHRVIQIAQKLGHGDPAVEALYAAHFERGVDVGRRDEIFDALRLAGLGESIDEIAHRLDLGEGEAEVQGDLARAREAQLRGVPCFIANERLALSGAQEVATFALFLQQAVHDALATQPEGCA